MKTRSGKNHYVCVFRIWDACGNLIHVNPDYRFTTSDPQKYIDTHVKRYPKYMRIEFTGLVNLDKEVSHETHES